MCVFFYSQHQVNTLLEGRTTRLSSTGTSRSRSSQEDFLCSDPLLTAAEPQYQPAPPGVGTTHSGRKAGGSSSSDVQFRGEAAEVCVKNFAKQEILNIVHFLSFFFIVIIGFDIFVLNLFSFHSTVPAQRVAAVRLGLWVGLLLLRDVLGRT